VTNNVHPFLLPKQYLEMNQKIHYNSKIQKKIQKLVNTNNPTAKSFVQARKKVMEAIQYAQSNNHKLTVDRLIEVIRMWDAGWGLSEAEREILRNSIDEELKMHPSNADGIVCWMYLNYDKYDGQTLLCQVENALKENPDHVLLLYIFFKLLASPLCLIHTVTKIDENNYVNAVKQFHRIVDLDQDFAENSEIYYYRGLMEFDRNSLEQAIPYFQLYLKTHTRSAIYYPDTCYYLAIALWHSKKLDIEEDLFTLSVVATKSGTSPQFHPAMEKVIKDVIKLYSIGKAAENERLSIFNPINNDTKEEIALLISAYPNDGIESSIVIDDLDSIANASSSALDSRISSGTNICTNNTISSNNDSCSSDNNNNCSNSNSTITPTTLLTITTTTASDSHFQQHILQPIIDKLHNNTSSDFELDNACRILLKKLNDQDKGSMYRNSMIDMGIMDYIVDVVHRHVTTVPIQRNYWTLIYKIIEKPYPPLTKDCTKKILACIAQTLIACGQDEEIRCTVGYILTNIASME